jgi:hypothetical protein
MLWFGYDMDPKKVHVLKAWSAASSTSGAIETRLDHEGSTLINGLSLDEFKAEFGLQC